MCQAQNSFWSSVVMHVENSGKVPCWNARSARHHRQSRQKLSACPYSSDKALLVLLSVTQSLLLFFSNWVMRPWILRWLRLFRAQRGDGDYFVVLSSLQEWVGWGRKRLLQGFWSLSQNVTNEQNLLLVLCIGLFITNMQGIGHSEWT